MELPSLGTRVECAIGVKDCPGKEAKGAILEKLDVRDMDDAKRATACETDSCVVRKVLPTDLANRELTQNFLPPGPAHTHDLLNDRNIDDFLDQMATAHPTFLHIPFQMIDFAAHGGPLANLDPVAEYENGKRMIGVVLNTDRTGGKGIHWFSLFIDMRTGGTRQDPWTVEYFNSSGRNATREVLQWQAKMVAMAAVGGNNYAAEGSRALRRHAIPLRVTDIVQQQDNHSCGPYSLYYIKCRIEGTPWRAFKTGRITDARMHEFRKHLFRSTE
jgi:hypothetical protein